jgi:hypothetical protein
MAGFTDVIAYGGGVFCSFAPPPPSIEYSLDNGLTWLPSNNQFNHEMGDLSIAVGGNDVYNIFMVSGMETPVLSTDGINWRYLDTSYDFTFDEWKVAATNTPKLTIPGTGLKNLIAVGDYIYASTGNVAVRIDTTQDLTSQDAYEFPAPLPDNQYVLANGPRYVYMFAQGDNTATNIVEFDPYPPTPIIKTSILVDYESLPPDVTKPDKALLGFVQTQKVTDMNYMNIKGPVKELWVTGAPDTANVFQYSNLAARSTLELTGEQIVTEDVGTRTFLKTIQAFETHTSMPIRNVSVIPFELDPESDIPNGTINFSRIRDQVFDGGAETVWAHNYNLLSIQGGIGGLIFNS